MQLPSSRVDLYAQTFLFGPGAIDRFAEALAEKGWRSVAVISTPSASAHLESLRHTALRNLDVVARFTDVRSHAPISGSEAIARQLAGRKLDALVAIGGGSASDTAKAVALVLGEGGHIEDHCIQFTPPDRYVSKPLAAEKLPIAAIPTTLSGAETTPGAGATTERNVKRGFWDTKLASAVACYDPATIAASPAHVLITTGMNGLAHCAEGLYAKAPNPFSSAYAIAATRRLAGGLRAVASGKASQADFTRLGEGAALGGLVIAYARIGIHHAICHVLGGHFGLPHGVANSIMLPHAMRFNLPAARSHEAQFVQALYDGDRRADGMEPPEAVSQFQREIGAPSKLRETSIQYQDLDVVANETMLERGVYFNTRPVESVKDVRQILEWAW